MSSPASSAAAAAARARDGSDDDEFTVSEQDIQGVSGLASTVDDFILYRVRGGERPGTCYFECEYGYDDCDGDPRNGCEVKVSACIDLDGEIGWDWINKRASNGCEVALGYTAAQLNQAEATPFSCTQVANKDNVNASAPIYCRGGQDGNLDNLGTCQFTCNAGYQDCDGNVYNGCESEIGDTSCSCVSCAQLPGTRAKSDDPLSSDSTISLSTCGADNKCTLPCNASLCSDADGDWTNGCETAIRYPTPRNSTAIGQWDCSSWAKNPLLAKKHHIDPAKLSLIACYGRTNDEELGGTCSFQGACLQRAAGGLFDYQDCNNDPRDGCEDTNQWCSVGQSVAQPYSTRSDRCSYALKYAPAVDCYSDVLTNVNTTALIPYCDRDATHLETRGGCVFTCNTGFADCDGLAQNGCEADVTDDKTCDYDCVNCNVLPGINRLGVTGCVADPNNLGRYKCQYECVGGSSASSCADRDGEWQNGCETALNADQDEEGIFVNQNSAMDCSVMQEEAIKNPELFRHHLHIDLTQAIPASVTGLDEIPAGSIFCNGLISTTDTAIGKCYFVCIPGFYNQDRLSFNGCEAAYTPANVGSNVLYPFKRGGYLIGDYEQEKYIQFLKGSGSIYTLPLGLANMGDEAIPGSGLIISGLYNPGPDSPVIWY